MDPRHRCRGTTFHHLQQRADWDLTAHAGAMQPSRHVRHLSEWTKQKKKKHHSLLFWVTRLTPPALNQETHTAEKNHSLYIHSRKAGTFPLIWKIAISSTWCCNLHRLKWIKSLSLKSESRFCNAAPTCMVSYGPSAPTWMSVFRIVLHINQDRKTSEISHQLSNSLLCLSVQQQKAKMAETHWYVYLLYHFTG